MWHGDDVEPVNAREVLDVGRIEGEALGDRDGSDHGVIGTRGGLSTGASQRRCYPGECSGSGYIKRERVEIRLRLLHLRLPGGPLYL